MFCYLQDQGGAGESSETQTVDIVREELITAVTHKINEVEAEIKECTAEIKACTNENTRERLWKEKEQLRDEKKLLLENKNLLLQQSGANSNLCISSRSPPFSSLLSSSFASS
jgi:hypothetical protein